MVSTGSIWVTALLWFGLFCHQCFPTKRASNTGIVSFKLFYHDVLICIIQQFTDIVLFSVKLGIMHVSDNSADQKSNNIKNIAQYHMHKLFISDETFNNAMFLFRKHFKTLWYWACVLLCKVKVFIVIWIIMILFVLFAPTTWSRALISLSDFVFLCS